MATKRKRSKYGVDITEKGKRERTYKGIQYDSKSEMQFYQEFLEPKIKSGEIIKVERQVTYVLQDGLTNFEGKKVLPIKYKSDFNVTYKNGTLVVYDVKGKADATSLLKRKLMWHRYPDLHFVFIGRSLIDGGWIEYDTLCRLRKERKKVKKNV